MDAPQAKPILFVRCEPDETFGVGPAAVEAAGGSVLEWNALDAEAPRPRLEDVDGVVMFGSSFNVEHADEQPFIKEVRELTREAVDTAVPYLGRVLRRADAGVVARRRDHEGAGARDRLRADPAAADRRPTIA